MVHGHPSAAHFLEGRMPARPAARRPGPILLSLLLSACVVHKVQVDETRAPVPDAVLVRSAVKAHLTDGGTVLYADGLTIKQGRLLGAGQRYGLRLQFVEVVQDVPVDSVVGLETYRTGTDGAATAGLSLLATAVGAAALAGAAIAIFGSCPTFYSDSAGTSVLEAEGFSYSIAPLFESRDVDRLRIHPGADGILRLEVRNEALETHFLNHLELIEAVHAPDEYVAPDPRGRVLAVRDLTAPAFARDRAGRDLAPALAAADGRVFASDSARLAGVSLADYRDYVDLVFPPRASPDSLGLVLRLRNSLLNTVLLYDVMLASHGGRALDWQAGPLSEVGPALELGTWYSDRMGLRVLIPTDTGYREVARVKDTGPIAWKEVALALPPATGDSLRVRLAFVTDNWRIDRVALASARRPSIRTLPLAEVVGADGVTQPEPLAAMARPDGRYLETRPGQWFAATWRTGPTPDGAARTFLLASRGYYVEWLRRDWIATGRDSSVFRPDDAALVSALRRWRGIQDSLEARFYASRIPVR
jgi:hypothetical protein